MKTKFISILTKISLFIALFFAVPNYIVAQGKGAKTVKSNRRSKKMRKSKGSFNSRKRSKKRSWNNQNKATRKRMKRASKNARRRQRGKAMKNNRLV